MLWAILVIFSLLVMALLIHSANRHAQLRDIDRLTLNKEVFHSRLQELKADLDAQRITESEFEQLELELKQSLLEDVPADTNIAKKKQSHVAIYKAMIAAVPVVSFVIYLSIADWKEYDKWQELVDNNRANFDNEVADSSWLESLTNQELILLLRSRLHENPQDTRSWIVLAQTFGSLGAVTQSIQAIERAIASAPNDISTKLTAAQLLARYNNDQAIALAKELIAQVLSQNPHHETAQAIAGFVHMQAGELEQAIETWEKLVDFRTSRGQGEGRGMDVLRQQIAKAKTQLAQNKHMQKAAFGVTVKLELDETIRSSVSSDARVFVIVKGNDGMPAPVAVKPLTVAQLPVSLELTDADAMMPGRVMSQMDKLSFQARLSISGKPKASSGDFESEMVEWSDGEQQPINLKISRKIP